ncbi:hypothetical protein DFH06DRAFT_1331031 [Mycena polygramma]|nr:hypothetical protein DFH06DRAFT_1331031 [Mycena polygramma]
MSAAHPNFPNEVLLHIFSHVVDANSLKAVVLTSQRFHNLGLQELLRTLVWNTTEKAQASIDFWERNDNNRRRIPTALSLNLNGRMGLYENESHPTILQHASLFRNLSSLSLSNSGLAVTFYQVLLNLPNLTHLNLVSCRVANAPPHFPYSFPSLSADPEVSVTHLTLSHVSTYHYIPPVDEDEDHPNVPDNHYVPLNGILPLFIHLPRLNSLTFNSSIRLPIFLPQITSLAIPAMHLEHAIDLLSHRLPAMPNIQHLRIGALPERPQPRTPPREDPQAPPPPMLSFGVHLPELESFVGPVNIARSLVPLAPLLSALTVNVFFAKTADALAMIECAKGSQLRSIELRVSEWDDELLLAITHSLRGCEEVNVVWRFGQPSDEFLFNLGIMHLSLLPQLRTLHLHAVPPLPLAPEPSYMYRQYHRHIGLGDLDSDSEDENATRAPQPVRAEAPSEDSCMEYLAVWTRYNPALRRVKFVDGREWTRAAVGRRWEPGSVEAWTSGGGPVVNAEDIE